MTTISCKNCGELIQGTYCHLCGEKIVEPNDFSLKTMLGDAIESLFNVDSKVYRTFKNLLFKPGKLTAKYIEGIRKPFIKPIQVFLITNILFFLLLTQADILRIPAKYFFNSGRLLQIENKIEGTSYTKATLMQAYDAKSSNLSKALVIFIVPVFALVLWVLNYNTTFLYGMHLVFSMHYLSFFFLCCLSAFAIGWFGNKAVQVFIVVLNFLYLFFAIKEVYQNKIWMSGIKALTLVIAFYGITVLYRTLVSYVSYNML